MLIGNPKDIYYCAHLHLRETSSLTLCKIQSIYIYYACVCVCVLSSTDLYLSVRRTLKLFEKCSRFYGITSAEVGILVSETKANVYDVRKQCESINTRKTITHNTVGSTTYVSITFTIRDAGGRVWRYRDRI